MGTQHIKSLLPPIVGGLLLGLSAIGQAASISATANWTLDGVAGSGSPDTDTLTGTGSVDILSGDSDGAGNSVFYHTFGNTSGSFGSRVSGTNNFDITGEFNFLDTFQNTSSIEQAATFSFSVIPGELDLDFFGSSMGASDFMRSGYEIDILLNGSSIWSSAAEIERLGTGAATFTETGTSIGGTYLAASERYFWNQFNATIDLGLIAAGQSFDLEYILKTTAASSLTGALDCTGGGYGEGEEVAAFRFNEEEEGGFGSCGSVTSRSGDPFGIGFPNTSSVSFSNPVPEPTSLLLLGMGLTGLLGVRRRRG